MKIEKQRIMTRGYEALLQVSENVTHDTWQLFLDMQRFNPYAKSERKKILQALEKIDRDIKKTGV